MNYQDSICQPPPNQDRGPDPPDNAAFHRLAEAHRRDTEWQARMADDAQRQVPAHCLAILGLTLPFATTIIKAVYRRFALVHHPDWGAIAEAFEEVHGAYQQALRLTGGG
jgi:hypothetical protein